jgi:hypothetical protein
VGGRTGVGVEVLAGVVLVPVGRVLLLHYHVAEGRTVDAQEPARQNMSSDPPAATPGIAEPIIGVNKISSEE